MMYHSKLAAVLLICSIVLSVCNGTVIYPKSLRTQSGSASTSSVSALATQDQSGSQDSWNKYVEFYGHTSAYKGIFVFDVSEIDGAAVSTYSLDVNYRGPAHSDQVWQFEYFVPSSNQWILAGDNTDAASWAWTELSFCGTNVFTDIVSAGSIQVRYSSTTAKDDSDLDFLAITITTGGSAPTNPATQAPTNPATQAPTNPATQAPTNPATQAPTNPATQAPTQQATSAPTQKATSAPTQKATSAPTQKATSAPTQKATSAPTQKATSAPTQKATSAPTQKATPKPTTAAPGGRMCPAGQVWAPAPGTTWQWQLTGTIDTSIDVQMYDIDLFDSSASTIATLHSQGKAVICYFSTQYEDWRPDAKNWPASVLGSELDGWPGENYVDIRSSIVRNLIAARLDLAVSKGCDGVEPDNVDGYANQNGLGLTAADQLDFNKFLANQAHARGLSVGLKNDLDQVSQLVSYFDWALDEQCNQYGECNYLTPFVTAGKAVFGVEYSGSASSFCSKMVTSKFSWLLKDLDLGSKLTQCCTYASGGCGTKPASRCINYNSKRTEIPAAEVEVVASVQQLAEVEYSAASASSVFPVVIVVVAAVAALVM